MVEPHWVSIGQATQPPAAVDHKHCIWNGGKQGTNFRLGGAESGFRLFLLGDIDQQPIGKDPVFPQFQMCISPQPLNFSRWHLDPPFPTPRTQGLNGSFDRRLKCRNVLWMHCLNHQGWVPQNFSCREAIDPLASGADVGKRQICLEVKHALEDDPRYTLCQSLKFDLTLS